MRGTKLFFSIAITLLTVGAGQSVAATFGTVVPIGGTASDIALDETRGVLYIADFGCGCIDVMSTADYSIQTTINVANFPAAIALSPSGRYLVGVHDGNYTTSLPPTAAPASGGNLVTVIDLNTQAQTVYALGEPGLGVTFVNTLSGDQGGLALIVTATKLMALDPETGRLTLIAALTAPSLVIGQPAPFLPGQFTQTAINTSADGWTAWGVVDAGTGTQVIFHYDAFNGKYGWGGWTTSPVLLPRVSVSGDGSYAMVGWIMFNWNLRTVSRYPNVVASTTITGHAWDSVNGLIYAQIPDAAMPVGTPTAGSNSVPTLTTPMPALLVMDADNLTYRERLTLRENLVGRAILSSGSKVMYAVSDSGVTVLPVGSLNQFNRVEPSQEDVLVQTSFCNRATVQQTFTLADPGGNQTDFEIVAGTGVTVSPSSGVTPATITVTADPTAFAAALGTSVVRLNILSASAINQPQPVRVLVSNPDENQRGSVVNVPGVLSDILPDAIRNRVYVLRQDRNKLYVYDGTTSQLISTLRTMTTPTGMAMTQDQKYVLVANSDSQLVSVFDLDALQPVSPITLPGSDFGRSIAVANNVVLALARDESQFVGDVVVLDLVRRVGTSMPTLGPWLNDNAAISDLSVLSASPNGANVLLAGPDGHVYLYSAASGNFVAARQDYTALSGAYGASNYGYYVVGSAFLNSSLVPVGAFNTAGGDPSGFAFTDQNNTASGYLTSAASPASPGTIQLFPSLTSTGQSPIPMVEAPALPSNGSVPTGSTAAASISLASADGTVSNNGSGSNALSQQTSFMRTVAPLPASSQIAVLSTSGFTILSQNYAASVTPPVITKLVNAADGTAPVAPGGLISVYGTSMSAESVATSQIPLPTALGQSCLSVNGTPVPLLFVSGTQINAQLPNNVGGPSTVNIHTPAGISNSFHFTVQSSAPSVFLSGVAGPLTGLATIVRAANNQLVTPTNPIRPGDTLVIYLTGMGLTSPVVQAGLPAPTSPLAWANIGARVTLGGADLTVQYAGLVPGEIGVYQINAVVPGSVTQGMTVPLVISQAGTGTTLNVRVVN